MYDYERLRKAVEAEKYGETWFDAVSSADIQGLLYKQTLEIVANPKTRPCDEVAGQLLASVINLATVTLLWEKS